MRAWLAACIFAALPLLPGGSSAVLASPDDEQRSVANAQAALERMGLYHGTTNGTLGPQTRDALSFYQRKLGLPVTARLDGRTELALANPELVSICEARHVVITDCLDAIAEFQAHIAGSRAGEPAGMPEETCRDARARSECIDAVAAMDKWLATGPKALK